MGNNPEGPADPNEKSGRFLCTSNKQDRKHNKTKARRKMTESVVMEEYDQMVAEGIQRQKTIEKQVNNNIRGSYMDRLGVNSRLRDSPAEPHTALGNQRVPNHATNNRVSGVSADTYAFDGRSSTNLNIVKDQSSPKEISRTTLQLNQEVQEQEDTQPSLRRKSTNVAGYFSSTPTAAQSNRFSMPAGKPQTARLTTAASGVDGPPQQKVSASMAFVPAPGSNSEIIEEENKQSQAESNNEELFKHLSYLSQLNNDVKQHQQVEQPGPGEYQIKLIDSSAASAASPASVKNQEREFNTTGAKRNDEDRFTMPFDLDDVGPRPEGAIQAPTRQRASRFSSRLNRMNSEDPRKSMGLRVRPGTENSTDGEATTPATTIAGDESKQTEVFHYRSGSTHAGMRLRRQGTELIHSQTDKTNLRSHSRSNQQIRTQLMSRLTYNKIWLRPQDKPKQSQTCIIFDWDDTILCTTFLAPHQHLIYEPNLKFPPTLQKRLSELDEVADDLLIKAKTFGRVYIVTNAAEGWVELSAARFLPKVFKTLQSDVTIISARTKYEKLYPRNYQKWKVQAFLETRADMEDDAITNLVALGDNIFEIEAAYILGSQYKSAYIKTVKFRQSPSTSELIKQIKLVLTQFDLICNSPKNLTVRLLKQSRNEEARERAAAQAAASGAPALDSGTATSAAIMQNVNANQNQRRQAR